jgi:MFS family permease
MPAQTIRKIFTRDFLLASIFQFALAFVFFVLIPTLPVYLSKSGSNEVEIGVLIGIFAVSSLFLRPFVGRALLRIPEKNFLMAGTLLHAFTSAAYIFTPPFWPFFIVRVLQGIGYAFSSTAILTFIANVSPQTHRGQSLGYFLLTTNIASALAPTLGMFLINNFSFTILFLVCSGLSIGALVIANQLGRREITPVENSSAEDGFYISRKALSPSIIGFFFFFVLGGLHAFFPLYAISHGVANPGLFFSTIAVMLILGRLMGGRILDLYPREKIILPCLITYIISMVILAFSKTLPMFILAAAIWGGGHAFLFPSLVAYVLDCVGSSPGPAMGTFTAISDLGMCLGPVMMGIVLHAANYPIMFLCLALIAFINLIYFYFFVRNKS